MNLTVHQHPGGKMTQDYMNAFSTYYGLHQIIIEPIHILRRSNSCINLVFTNETNLIVDSGVHPSMHQNCHYQVAHCELNLNTELPPPCNCRALGCNKAEIENIQK